MTMAFNEPIDWSLDHKTNASEKQKQLPEPSKQRSLAVGMKNNIDYLMSQARL